MSAHPSGLVRTGWDGRPVRQVVAAALVLAVVMGFGRFAFTAVYPLMVHDGLLSVRTGSLAASANYAGYLLGAIGVSRAGPASAGRLCRFGLLASVLALLGMALPGGPLVPIAVRFVAGVASAVALIGVSTWLFQVVRYPAGTPAMFAGVGAGIVVSSELIALGKLAGWSSPGLWLLLAAAAGCLLALAWRSFGPAPGAVAAASPAPALSPDARGADMGAWPLILVYSLAGFGYIITATYLPLFVRQALGSVDPVQVWAAFGLGAVPSCLLWHRVQQRWGTRRALGANLAVQLVGVVLPAISHAPAAFLLSAVLVGATFVGTAAISISSARLVASRLSFNILAVMTAGYGIGQILGPLVSDYLFHRTGGFDAPLWAAGVVLGVAVAICAYGLSRPALRAS
jgi:hypothetical protein